MMTDVNVSVTSMTDVNVSVKRVLSTPRQVFEFYASWTQVNDMF